MKDWRGAIRAGAAAFSFVVASAGALELNGIAGVYKHRFVNGDVSGGRFDVEDVMEIVNTSSTSGYVKARFNFFNGHQCGFAVIADVDGDDGKSQSFTVTRSSTEVGRAILATRDTSACSACRSHRASSSSTTRT